MSLTPSNARMRDATLGAGIKLTPTPLPFTATKNNPRSPVKAARAEATLALRTVIGTTTSTANAFDSLPTARCFAYTAGTAAVIATVDEQHNISQRFYRARPTTNPINSSSSIYGGPATPTQNESRNRITASLREAGLGASPHASPATNDWNDSPNNRAWTAREKIKAATCVSFSPDGKYLAVGETGYKPRVLIFSNSSDAPSDTPLTALSEHSFGVNCVAFSPDSRYLASIGTAQDGFLYVWSINPRTGAATLHSSNKCVSNINQMTWMGNKLITVGTRHVKVWSLEDRNPVQRVSKPRQSDMFSGSTHKPLSGRNCLLGDLQDATFTSVCQVALSKAIVASERGDLCLIDETERDQNFSRVAHAGFSISSMATDGKGRLHLAGTHGGLKTLTVASLTSKLTPPPSPSSQGSRGGSPTISITDCSNQISAIACLAEHIVTVDSQRAIRLSHLCAASVATEDLTSTSHSANDETSIGDVIHTLPAQGDSVLGVRVLSRSNNLDASYYTWAAGGSVIFWSQTGSTQRSLQVALEQPAGSDFVPNELRTVRASSDASFLVTGDKMGVLRIIDCRFETVIFESRAHSNEVTSIAIFEDESSTLVASASRDRTVQIFSRERGKWTLLQTLDEHAGAVLGIQFSQNGTRLVSSSSDRSIVVREMLSREEDGETIRVFVFLRCIAFKSTPVSMTWDVDQDDVLIASSVDRQVHKFDVQSGQCLSNFKASDSDGGDAVVLHSLAHIPREWGSPLIAGVSSTDKSIRVYDESGTLLARDWGHTEGVTDIAFVQPSNAQDEDSRDKSLVTVAVDGTIFVWSLTLQSPYRQEMYKSLDVLGTSAESTTSLLLSKPPIRRVLSQSGLAKFQRSPDDSGSATPTGSRSPTLKKKLSKFSLDKTQTPKLDPSPLPSSVRERRNGGTTNHTFLRRKNNTSPSPPASPKARVTQRRASVDVRSRPNLRGPASEYGSLAGASESFCRQLKAYRKRLASSTEALDTDIVKEIQRELAATARTIGERAKTKEFDETAMAKLLDQYSERLVNILDERIAASVALRTRQDSEAALSTPLRSPADYRQSPSSLGQSNDTTAGDEESREILTPITTSTETAEEVSER
ncbi:WD repeat protein-like protein [Macroventuria anomochaeta]|uniref:WD repeat protein-like protein n=1 Tax=Macroventuria anomochaeta TaxID=301207 RepID=A0ACB6S5K2_9PLEO|nr:WD repeat protein-like protein [Macroventuria anomochaeta]KAF2629520.1 WD repeat protein-like protein [Macroventuria anomochaeta]